MFDEIPPDRSIWRKYKKLEGVRQTYIPRAKRPERKEFEAIPRLMTSKLSDVVKYKLQMGPSTSEGGIKLSVNPGFEIIGKKYFIVVHDWVKWRPGKDLKEITMAEFEKIKKQSKARKKK
jgi:hypothetical protein